MALRRATHLHVSRAAASRAPIVPQVLGTTPGPTQPHSPNINNQQNKTQIQSSLARSIDRSRDRPFARRPSVRRALAHSRSWSLARDDASLSVDLTMMLKVCVVLVVRAVCGVWVVHDVGGVAVYVRPVGV